MLVVEVEVVSTVALLDVSSKGDSMSKKSIVNVSLVDHGVWNRSRPVRWVQDPLSSGPSVKIKSDGTELGGQGDLQRFFLVGCCLDGTNRKFMSVAAVRTHPANCF